jgi:pimeloyl-ACP methyl ester carboxylesterase
MTRMLLTSLQHWALASVDLFGFSLGGFIAQTMAVIRPDLLSKIMPGRNRPTGAKALYSFPQLVEKAFQVGSA